MTSHLTAKCEIMVTTNVRSGGYDSVFVAILLCRAALAVEDSIRDRRLIGGLVLDKKNAPYKAVDYFVWVGRTWDCYEDVALWKKLLPPVFNLYALGIAPCGKERPNRGRFGGAMITPYIVQTACHVLASFSTKKGFTWGTTKIMRKWENKLQVYMGQTDVVEFKYPIYVSYFVIHPGCAQLGKWPYYAKNDIGWVVIEDDIFDSKGAWSGKWGRIDYAGPYKRAQLKEFHSRIESQMHVCLLIGFGVVLYTGGAPMSQYLRHGWIQLLDYYSCYLLSYKLVGLDGVYSYNRTRSWVCSVPMKPPWGSHHTFGDSGTPISCDNVYFAVVSGAVGLEGDDNKEGIAGVKKLSMDTAIRYSLEANAVEYRKEFENDVGYEGEYVNREELRASKPLDGSIKRIMYKHFHKKPTYSSAMPLSSSPNMVPSDLAIICIISIVASNVLYSASSSEGIDCKLKYL